MANDDSEYAARIEAALYAAGRPLTMDELVRASGTTRARTIELVDGMVRRTRKAFRAIEVAALPDGSFVLQIKPEYAKTVRRFASRPLLPRATLKTLSYIAYMQPVSSRQLAETRGTGVYSHIRDLLQMDFITHQSAGRLKIYTTTEKFSKYFGIHGDAEDLKQRLFAKMRRQAGTADTNLGGHPPRPATQ